MVRMTRRTAAAGSRSWTTKWPAPRGKTGWREVEIARGSSDQTCPVHALTQWLHYARIDFGPLFVAVSRNGLKPTTERLSDKHIARLIKACACEAGLRPDLPEAERVRLFSGHSLRAGLASFGRGRRAVRAEAARPRLGRNDPPVSAPPRQVPRQPDQGCGAIAGSDLGLSVWSTRNDLGRWSREESFRFCQPYRTQIRKLATIWRSRARGTASRRSAVPHSTC